jgi:hypothetical protein
VVVERVNLKLNHLVPDGVFPSLLDGGRLVGLIMVDYLHEGIHLSEKFGIP